MPCYDFATCKSVYRRDVTGVRDPDQPGRSLDTLCGTPGDLHACSEDEWQARRLGDLGSCIVGDWESQSACCCGHTNGGTWPDVCPARDQIDCRGAGGREKEGGRDHVGCSDMRGKEELLRCCMRRRMDSGRPRPGVSDDRPFPHAVCDAVLKNFKQDLGPPSEHEFDEPLQVVPPRRNG
jgi:hypothetical protein